MTSRTLLRIPLFILFAYVCLSASRLVGQAPKPDPWLDFPSYDSPMIWQLRQSADAKAARELVQEPASVDTFTRLVRSGLNDDALMVLKRTLETADTAQTIDALHALSETMFEFQRDGIDQE